MNVQLSLVLVDVNLVLALEGPDCWEHVLIIEDHAV
jgi:hypothetical protein